MGMAWNKDFIIIIIIIIIIMCGTIRIIFFAILLCVHIF